MMSSQEHVTIERLVNFFQSGESLEKEKKTTLKESIKIFKQCAVKVGLTREHIHIIAELVATHKFGEILSDGLVHTLLPRESVAEDTMLMIVSKICADVQSLKVKTLLIRWMVLVFDLVPSKTRYHCVYGLLFRYIYNETLCPHICHLLYLLTRKCDVTHYRIARLLELQRRVGSQPHISGLLSLYRMYHPSLISMKGKYRKFFEADKAWEKLIATVQQRYGLNLLNESLFHEAAKAIKSGAKKTPLIQKPSFSMVHDTQTTHYTLSSVISGTVPIYQIKSFKELLDHIGQLDITSQAYTLLSSKVLQHVLAITPDRTVALRLSFWLHHWLNMEILSNSGETERGKELLTATLQFSSLIQECLPVCEDFLFRYLWVWNGSDYRTYILNLISKLRLMPFSDLQQKFLIPLKKLYDLSLHVYFKCAIIGCLSDLLTNYVTLESRRFDLMNQEEDEIERAQYQVYPANDIGVDETETISELVRFVDDLYVGSVRTVDKPVLLLHYVLQFHYQVSTLYPQHKKPVLLLPSIQILFNSVISLSAPCIALISRILFNHIQTASALQEKGPSLPLVKKTAGVLNRYCLDVFDALWRRRSFHPLCQDDTVIFPDFDSSLFDPILTHPEDLSPSRMFSVDRHPALISFTIEYLRISRKDFTEVEAAEFVLESSFMEYLRSNKLKDVADFICLLQAE